MKRNYANDYGFQRAIFGARNSAHQNARAVAANFERYDGLTEDEDILFWTSGQVPFGFVEDSALIRGRTARLKLESLNRHCLIVGATGYGKTNLARILADGLMDYVPVMIFDRTGDHINCYSRHNPIVFPIKNLRLNPNEEPPGVPYSEWLEIYSSVLMYSLFLTDVSRGTFMQLLRHTEEYFDGARLGYRSSVFEQRSAIDRVRPRSYRDSARMNYWSRLEDRYDSMIASTLGEVFSCYRGHDIRWLLSHNIIFDCMGVSSQVLKILISLLLTKIYTYRLYNSEGGSLLHVSVLEEAENVFKEVRAGGFIENPLDDMIRRMRGRGESLIVINQTYTTLSSALRSNVAVQFMMGASNAFQRTEIGRSIGLRGGQWNQAANLSKGYAFVSAEGRNPRYVFIPLYGITNGDAGTRVINSADRLAYVPVPQKVKDELKQKSYAVSREKSRAKSTGPGDLEIRKVLELLADIRDRPFVKYTLRSSLSFAKSRSELFRVLERAKTMKLIRQVYIKINRGRGQRGLYLELTAKGIDLLTEHDLHKERKPYYAGKMGFAGALVLNRILVPYYEQAGYRALIEGVNRGSDCDLGIIGQDNQKVLAAELSITTNAAHEAENIRRNFKAGWPRTESIVMGIKATDEDTLEENDIKTAEKAREFRKYFEEHFPPQQLANIVVSEIKKFRR